MSDPRHWSRLASRGTIEQLKTLHAVAVQKGKERAMSDETGPFDANAPEHRLYTHAEVAARVAEAVQAERTAMAGDLLTTEVARTEADSATLAQKIAEARREGMREAAGIARRMFPHPTRDEYCDSCKDGYTHPGGDDLEAAILAAAEKQA
jgi:hypothetical protein